MNLISLILQTFLSFALVGIIFLLIYYHYTYGYWKRRGVPYLKPKFPLGNAKHLFLLTSNYTTVTQSWYNELKKKDVKFGGVWDLCKPVLVVLDPDYIRDILTKDFQYFVNRDFYHNDKYDPPANLFLSKNDRWKFTRQKLTSIFSSGKMKMMFDGIVRCSNDMVDFLGKSEFQDVDVKQVMAHFTINVIGSCIFGHEVDSFKEPNNEFRLMALKIFTRSFTSKYFNYPLIRKFGDKCSDLGIKSYALGQPKHANFFAELIKDAFEYRKKNNVQRPDFIQLMMELHGDSTDKKSLFDFEMVVANTMLFFVAGFDTSSTAMNFALNELARNPDVQEKARDEILKVLKRHDGKLTYEAVGEMTYIRQVFDETLRLYPSVPNIARVCVQDYKLSDSDVVIEKGTSVVIPLLGLGYDPEHFSEPTKFDPDRFNTENKAGRHPYVHLPFGEGPRNCIGLRFGLMQSSIGIIQILKNFRVVPSPSAEKLTLSEKTFLLQSEETLYLKFEKI